VDVRRDLARTVSRERPWQLLVNRQAVAEAVREGAALSGALLDRPVALAIVDSRGAPASPAVQAVQAVGQAWCDLLGFLATASDPVRPARVDEGLVRTLHWLLHRTASEADAGRVRPDADLTLPPAPPGADAVDRAIWAAAAVRRAEPCWSGNAVVAHAVEVLLLAQADGLAPWYAGRPAPTGDPREVLHATATAHLRRCGEAEQRWFDVAGLLAAAGLPDRMAGPSWDAATGLPLVNASYRAAAAVVRRRPVGEQQASRDLRAMVEARLLQPAGRTRDRTYRWTG